MQNNRGCSSVVDFGQQYWYHILDDDESSSFRAQACSVSEELALPASSVSALQQECDCAEYCDDQQHGGNDGKCAGWVVSGAEVCRHTAGG